MMSVKPFISFKIHNFKVNELITKHRFFFNWFIMTGTYDEYIYFIISYDMLRFHQHLLFGNRVISTHHSISRHLEMSPAEWRRLMVAVQVSPGSNESMENVNNRNNF